MGEKLWVVLVWLFEIQYTHLRNTIAAVEEDEVEFQFKLQIQKNTLSDSFPLKTLLEIGLPIMYKSISTLTIK